MAGDRLPVGRGPGRTAPPPHDIAASTGTTSGASNQSAHGVADGTHARHATRGAQDRHDTGTRCSAVRAPPGNYRSSH